MSILTTERYDNQRLEALEAAVTCLGEGKTFGSKGAATVNGLRPTPRPKFQESFKIRPRDAAKEILRSN
jgi:hypothetical protein